MPGSELARQRPELLLRDARGEHVIAGNNWGSGYHALDLSRPAARDYLAELTHRVVHEWGFKYLKLDFVNAGAAPGVRADVDAPAENRMQAASQHGVIHGRL